MAEKFGWFDVPLGGDPTKYKYSADEMRNIWRSMITNGIVPEIKNTKANTIIPDKQIGSSLSATVGQGLKLMINKGIAWIDGAYYILTEPKEITLQKGWTNDIVLRLDLTGSDVVYGIFNKQRSTGTIEAGLTRAGGVYELGLHTVVVPADCTQITSSMITDHRLNMAKGSDDLPCCGICGSLLMPDVDEWYKNANEQQKGWYQIAQSQFTTWFNSLKDVLDENTATNLFNLIDTHQKDQTVHVTQFTHTKTGITHELTGTLPTSGIVTARFKATADYADGDTFKINGVDYQAKPTGEETKLPNKAFIAGDIVSCEIDIDGKKVNFKIGGSGGFPASWKDERTAIAREPINKDTAIAMMKYGDVTNQLSYMPMDVPIKAVGTLKVSGNGKILACCDTMHANGSDGIDIYFIDELTNSLIKLPNPSIMPSLPKYIAVNDDGRFIVTIERSPFGSDNDGLSVRLYKTDTVASSSIYNHMNAITCAIRSDFTIYNAIIYGDLLYMYISGVDGEQSWGHYVLVLKISNDGTTLVFVKTTRLDSSNNTYGRMVMSKTGLMLIGYYNQTEDIHHVSLYRITETGLGSKLFDKSNYSSATISLSPMGKNFAIHNTVSNQLELWQFPNYDGGGVPVKIWETPNKYSTVGFLGVDNLLYYITESAKTRVVGIEGARVTILNDNLTQSEILNDNCDNIKYCVSYRNCYPLTQKSFATNLDSVYAQASLSKNKYLEFGIGIAQETKNTGEQIKVNLFSPINQKLGGIY